VQRHRAVQRGLFEAVAFVVNRRAILRPLGLPEVVTSHGLKPRAVPQCTQCRLVPTLARPRSGNNLAVADEGLSAR